MGINDYGVVSVVMNREGTLGPEIGKRSRGELVLKSLDHADSAAAVEALSDMSLGAYRPFNLFLADRRNVYWIKHTGIKRTEAKVIAPGLHMLSSGELDDTTQPRIQIYLPLFMKAGTPDPYTASWDAWLYLLASREYAAAYGPQAAMNLEYPNGFGTLSSSLVALSNYPESGQKPIWLFADGAPDRVVYKSVTL